MKIDFEKFLRKHGVYPLDRPGWREFTLTHYQVQPDGENDALIKQLRVEIGRGVAGVYVYFKSNGKCLYVGKAAKLRDRVRDHYQRCYKQDPHGDRTNRFFNFWSARPGEVKVLWFPIEDEENRQIVEIMLTKLLKPEFCEAALILP